MTQRLRIIINGKTRALIPDDADQAHARRFTISPRAVLFLAGFVIGFAFIAL